MNEKKMIDPADVRALLDEYDDGMQTSGDRDWLIDAIRDLLPRDYPEDMFGMWAEHETLGQVLVCSIRPDNIGDVAVRSRKNLGGHSSSPTYVPVSSLTFSDQHPETLTTIGGYSNAPSPAVDAGATRREGAVMASNFDRAVDVLNEHWSVAQLSGEEDETICCVQRLQEAGLLAPEPPETLTPETHPEWAHRYLEDWECLPEVEWHAGKDFFISIFDHEKGFNAGFGVPQEEWLFVTPSDLRGIAAVLLAAADYADKEHK